MIVIFNNIFEEGNKKNKECINIIVFLVEIKKLKRF